MHVALEYLKLKPYALLSFDNSRVSVPKISRTLCPVVLLVLLRIGLLPIHLCHSHDGEQRNELFVVI